MSAMKGKDSATYAKLSACELATTLAALRFWQAHTYHDMVYSDIATDGGRLTGLRDDEIDALCERLNRSLNRIKAPADQYRHLDREIREQELWINDHGRNLEGYVRRYGSLDNPDHFGNGGEAIFAADWGHLLALKARRKP